MAGAAMLAGGDQRVGMPAGAILWLIPAALLGIGAILVTSQANMAPTLVGFACLMGIIARMTQAAYHHRKP